MRSANFRMLLTTVVVLLTVVTFTGCMRRSRAAGRDAKSGGADLPVKEEIRQTYKLAAATKVNVSGINGSVDIQTSDTDTAEIHIVRSARDQDTLSQRKTIVEHEADTLTIRNDKNSSRGLWDALKGSGELRTRVMLKLPRNIRLDIGGVNGHVTTGEIDGAVELSGINGKIKVAQVTGAVSASGINGPMDLGIRKPDDPGKKGDKQGVDLSGINGPIELHFSGDVNADLDVSGFNGGFHDEGMNVQLEEKRNRHNFSGKIGNGGASISVSGVNGSLTLMKAGQTSGSSAASPAK